MHAHLVISSTILRLALRLGLFDDEAGIDNLLTSAERSCTLELYRHFGYWLTGVDGKYYVFSLDYTIDDAMDDGRYWVMQLGERDINRTTVDAGVPAR